MTAPTTLAIYAGAALAEIAGCFAVWAWMRQGASAFWLVPGILSCRVALKCGIRKSTKSMGSGQNMGVMRRVFCLRRSVDHQGRRPL